MEGAARFNLFERAECVFRASAAAKRTAELETKKKLYETWKEKGVDDREADRKMKAVFESGFCAVFSFGFMFFFLLY